MLCLNERKFNVQCSQSTLYKCSMFSFVILAINYILLQCVLFSFRYGMLYIQHAHVFHALFTTLEKYYDDGREPLEAKLNEFFSILTRKMFEVLNAQYEFNDAYLSC